MLDKEVGELRRRFRYQKNNISTLYGCFVNGNKEIITTFSRSFQLLDQDEQEKYLGLFRRNLAGNVGKSLFPLPTSRCFPPRSTPCSAPSETAS